MCRKNCIRGGIDYVQNYERCQQKRSNPKHISNKEGANKGEVIISEEIISSDTFSYVAQKWLYTQRAQLKESSVAKYNNILNSHLLPRFGHSKVGDITRDDVLSFSSNLLISSGSGCNGLSAKTVTSIISVMKNILRYSSQIMGYSVVDLSEVYVRQPQNPMRVLTILEQQKLNTFLYDNLNYCNLGVLICLYTGLRIGELCALK